MNTYWCRYFEPNGIPPRHKLEAWPDGMKAWVSGHGDDDTVWCARVDAKNADEAKAIIRSCYGNSGERIVIDSIQEYPRGWRPSGRRFPE